MKPTQSPALAALGLLDGFRLLQAHAAAVHAAIPGVPDGAARCACGGPRLRDAAGEVPAPPMCRVLAMAEASAVVLVECEGREFGHLHAAEWFRSVGVRVRQDGDQ